MHLVLRRFKAICSQLLHETLEMNELMPDKAWEVLLFAFAGKTHRVSFETSALG